MCQSFSAFKSFYTKPVYWLLLYSILRSHVILQPAVKSKDMQQTIICFCIWTLVFTFIWLVKLGKLVFDSWWGAYLFLIGWRPAITCYKHKLDLVLTYIIFPCSVCWAGLSPAALSSRAFSRRPALCIMQGLSGKHYRALPFFTLCSETQSCTGRLGSAQKTDGWGRVSLSEIFQDKSGISHKHRVLGGSRPLHPAFWQSFIVNENPAIPPSTKTADSLLW